jgi:hypothetical protein
VHESLLKIIAKSISKASTKVPNLYKEKCTPLIR